jgi:uncharacterized membrane protein YdjX (TVP38/TMEM64 family)
MLLCIPECSFLTQQIVLLLRLVPLLPFNMLNYLLSVTPVPIGEYMLASWLGMMVSSLHLNCYFSLFSDLNPNDLYVLTMVYGYQKF